MCGGSKTVYDQTTGRTTTQSDLPDWAKPYFEAQHSQSRGRV